MSPARRPPSVRDGVRLLALDPAGEPPQTLAFTQLPDLLDAGDLLVVNDAATLPASIFGELRSQPIEVRLAGQLDDQRWQIVLFGAGDWHARTEDRPAPPAMFVGDKLVFENLSAVVESIDPTSSRLATIRFSLASDALYAALYATGRPVQYSHLCEDLDLWSVQTVYAARPWAVEMPSAGRALSWRLLEALRERGVRVATLTHAAGLSATGDDTLDAALPLPERYDLPATTVRAIESTRAAGNRVVAVGTTVVRALEGNVFRYGRLVAGEHVTELVLDECFEPRVVDGLISGVHEPHESHYRLLRAFAPEQVLRDGLQRALAAGFRTHEFGDATLLLGQSVAPHAA